MNKVFVFLGLKLLEIGAVVGIIFLGNWLINLFERNASYETKQIADRVSTWFFGLVLIALILFFGFLFCLCNWELAGSIVENIK